MSTDAHSTEAAPAKKKKPLVLIAAVMLLLGGGGGGAYWWFVARPAAAGAAAPKVEEKPAEKPGILPLEAFVVNLADPGGARYLRVTLSLLIEGGEEHAKELEEDAVTKMKIRSVILELLALQTADKLTTPDGKSELKKAIAEGVEHGAQAGKGHDKEHGAEQLKISDVLFSEFIVQ
jgi:flagellar FliL protein